MADKNAEQIKALYTELSKIAPSQDWERILKVAKKILGLALNEKKAFQTKIVCLINLDKFDEALTSIERFQDASDMSFEKAYCEYRLNKIEQAYETLQKSKQQGVREKELLAQVTYRLEKYQESYDLYRDVVRNLNDDFDNERQTNLSAVVASLRSTTSQAKDLDMSENEKKTYELCYNSACISLSKGNFQEAQEKLKKAELMCKKTFEDDPENAEDQEAMESEMAIIRVQLAYCLQKLGKVDEASKIYNNVLKAKQGDIGIVAVVSNNLVCINKDQNVFDSKKRIKAATGNELDLKLNSFQRRVIAFNEILLSIITNQNDAVQKLLKQFELKFNDKERLALLKMSQLIKEKKIAEAEKTLNDLISNTSGECSNIVKFYLIQTQLLQGKANEAIETFKTLDEFKIYKLGIVSALVSLLTHKGDKQEISKLFENAIEYFNSTSPKAKELEVYIRENSNFQIRSGNLQSACEMLEKMRTLYPDDFRILSKLINIYSRFDSEKAKKLSNELPSLDDVVANSNIDIDNLESQFSLMSYKFSKLKTAVGSGGQVKSPSVKSPQSIQQQNEKLKKKKKRKIRLPKNIDPNVPIDAERWLPLRERSYYKGRRNKKRNTVGKGTQGAVSKEPAQQGATAQAETPQTPGGEKPSDKPKPKPNVVKKKKKGGKW